LASIGTLREEAAELVEAPGGGAQNPVRVVIDEPDPVQYFSK
jgi:hypothetical protein